MTIKGSDDTNWERGFFEMKWEERTKRATSKRMEFAEQCRFAALIPKCRTLN